MGFLIHQLGVRPVHGGELWEWSVTKETTTKNKRPHRARTSDGPWACAATLAFSSQT
jgi:hypothetical protein